MMIGHTEQVLTNDTNGEEAKVGKMIESGEHENGIGNLRFEISKWKGDGRLQIEFKNPPLPNPPLHPMAGREPILDGGLPGPPFADSL
jgi:hypothetical protein